METRSVADNWYQYVWKSPMNRACKEETMCLISCTIKAYIEIIFGIFLQ